MATGQKISAQTVATSFDSGDLMTIVQSGANKSVDHDVLMDDTQICKAWVNFNGTGTIAIRDDFNVSSITDNGTGDYTVNFTNAMSDANYSISAMGSLVGTDGRQIFEAGIARSATSFRINTNSFSDTLVDSTYVSIQVYGS